MNQSALIIIDVQKGFDDSCWGTRNNPNAELNINLLLNRWRENNWSVIHVQHCSVESNSPLRPDVIGNEFKEGAMPIEGEVIFTKTVNSAFIGTNLENHLRANKITDLVLVGLTIDHCVSTSTRMAGNFGFNVTLISDATATFDRTGPDGTHYSADEIHNIHLASLNGEFCVVKNTLDVLG